MLLLAPRGTNARLDGVLRAHTDANGTAALRPRLVRGRSATLTLLFSAEAVLQQLNAPGEPRTLPSVYVSMPRP